MNSPTHEHGHALDLVLAYGLPVCNLEVCDATFSDHIPVLFEMYFSCNPKPNVPVCCCRSFSPSTVELFSDAFKSIDEEYSMSSSCLNTEELTLLFNSTCHNILDIVARFKVTHAKTKVEPWLNDITRAVRQECWRAECSWKKDRIQVSSDILKEGLHKYQKTVKI